MGLPFPLLKYIFSSGYVSKAQGVSLYAAHLKGEHYYTEEDYTKACGFLIGNEGNGLTQQVIDACTAPVIIPMAGKAESLNAAIAASIVIWEMCR